MAAYDHPGRRPRGFLHDWMPLIVVAVLCCAVVYWNVRL